MAVLGVGRAGRTLLEEFAAAGVSVVGAWNRSVRSDLPESVVSGDPSAHLEAWAPDLVLVAVRDDVIPSFIASLRVPPGTVVAHTSGSLDLASVPVIPGAHLGGWHPLQSFGSSTGGDVPVPPYWVALDGDDRAMEMGRRLADLTGHPSVPVRGSAKAAYHAAAVLASNALVALEAAAVRVMESAGVPREACWQLLLPLVHGTLNNLHDGDFQRAITGPVARGDASTVTRNLAATDGVEGTTAIYQSLGREALRVVGNDLTDDIAAAVAAALNPDDNHG